VDRPDYQNADYSGKLAAQWQLVDAELGGTYEMQSHPEYLPQFPAEHDEVYQDRLAVATFDNDYADTLDGIVGMIFRRPAQLGDNVPAQIKADLENVDLAGTAFNVFAPRFVRKGVHYGEAYIVVDMQRVETPDALDAATARDLNLRPYWIAYSAKQVQNQPRYVVINGAKTLQQIVFRECVTEPDGAFGEREVIRYRVWRLPVVKLPNGQYAREVNEAGQPQGIEWEVWEEQQGDTGPGGSDPQKEIVMVDSGVIDSLSRLPVSRFLANPDTDDDTKCAGPALYDLAELCKKDWQQQSDHESNLHLCSSPIPFTVGLREDGALSNQAWGKGVRYDLEVGGTLGYAEPAGTALEAMERQLASNKEKIRQKGLEMVLEGGAPNTTATEQLLRAGKRASRLAMITEAAKDCFEGALGSSAEWYGMGADAGGEISMGVKGDELILTSADIQALSSQVANGQLSIRELLRIEKRAGILSDDLDEEAQIDEIADERGRIMAEANGLQDGDDGQEEGDQMARRAA
jgi:hypothetical protein